MFRIFLPQGTGVPNVVPETPPEPTRLRGTETILVVEDEESLCRLAHSTLEAAGYTVLSATNGEGALRISSEYAGLIHLVVTDVIMPDLSGTAVFTALLQRRPTLQVLYMSGYPDDALGHHGVLAEGINFLHKPFTGSALVRKIRKVLDAGGTRLGRGGSPVGSDPRPQPRGGTDGSVAALASAGAAPDAPSPTTAAPAQGAPRRGRVLVVDDEDAICDLLHGMLVAEHDVTTSTSARDALRRLSAGERFDVILCDLSMPEMSGMELHAELNRIAPGQASRMTFLTGGAVTPEAREFVSAGHAVVEKPITRDRLRAIVAERLRTPALT